MDFTVRSKKAELIDTGNLAFEEIRRNMYELEIINSFLGGHRITIKGVQKLLKEFPPPNRPLTICEIGSGGGDNIMALSNWFRKKKQQVYFIGVDINPHCIKYATGKNDSSEITFILSDYKKVVFEKKPDIIFSSLFCHHFSNDQLIEMLIWMKEHTGIGFFINDLHRHPVAYHSIRILTGLLSKSRLVKNDAPLSVLRGFRREEWEGVLHRSGISEYSLDWMWAFRWLLVAKMNSSSKI